MAFAIIETGGKQYRVSPGDKIKVEKLDAEEGKGVVFDKVLLAVDGDNVEIGTPMVSGVKVEGKVLEQGRGEKKIVFKYKAKTRQRTKRGHRQPYTQVEITAIK
ncbi:MAG: 50S ribosomal protein L21 [Candidatus Harrisonbacteria bacterium CG10_big_fil_rev_8_21_14_0_10_44_23]|uniref:Large ribosomal subunit protein bL21 n=1 Tax=Candidatus Harrisonbacteria bacterium CG10_big_fil_rev_8_21_14_0_10_44_23 TaxID=1974585 RepID=A0A2H0URM6_9BACT|nr:MAG: 50S ribosomal protein L21 [Candidatus Harrisonbacteria bacterium CG10_big_fil_rev_8_21_14_0_10_44_23]